MRSDFQLSYKPVRHRAWQKWLAVALLIWAGIDMALPSVCGEDLLGLSTQATSVESVYSPGKSDQFSFAYEDDCFCCCSHIFPSPHFELSSMVASTPVQVISLGDQPEGLIPSHSQPPRS